VIIKLQGRPIRQIVSRNWICKVLDPRDLLPIVREGQEQRILVRISPNLRTRRARGVHHTCVCISVMYLFVNYDLSLLQSPRSVASREGNTVEFENKGIIASRCLRYSSLFWAGRPIDEGGG
jgi:hypothetical protein